MSTTNSYSLLGAAVVRVAGAGENAGKEQLLIYKELLSSLRGPPYGVLEDLIDVYRDTQASFKHVHHPFKSQS